MDQALKNRQVKSEMVKSYGMPWQEIWNKLNWGDLIWRFRMDGGRCVACGGYVTAMNLKFFNFNVSMVRCYKCQNLIKK